MSTFKIELQKTYGYVDGDTPVPVWIATCENAGAYAEQRAKTPGEALRKLADEFDVEWGVTPSGNWDEYPDVHIGK